MHGLARDNLEHRWRAWRALSLDGGHQRNAAQPISGGGGGLVLDCGRGPRRPQPIKGGDRGLASVPLAGGVHVSTPQPISSGGSGGGGLSLDGGDSLGMHQPMSVRGQLILGGGLARDLLEQRWRTWRSFVARGDSTSHDECHRNTARPIDGNADSLSLDGIRQRGMSQPMGSDGGVYAGFSLDGGGRGWGGLIREEAAVVAWKHWRRAAMGRPLSHDPEVAVAWLHWKHLHTLGCRRRALADAMGQRVRAAREGATRRRDEASVRAERRRNLRDQRQRRRAEDRADFVTGDVMGEVVDERAGGQVLDFTTFSYTVSCWRRWRLVTATRQKHLRAATGRAYRFNAKRAEAEKEYARGYTMSNQSEAEEDYARGYTMSKQSEKTEVEKTIGIHGLPQSMASDKDISISEEATHIAGIARKRLLPPRESVSGEQARTQNAAAVKLQARARTFLAMRQFALLRRNPSERVKGLTALLNRGQDTFDQLNAAAAASELQCDAAEQRLALIRLANEDAMGSLRIALGKLDDVRRAREPCGARWDSRKLRIQNWERQYNDSFEKDRRFGSYKPWPSFPSPRNEGGERRPMRGDGGERAPIRAHQGAVGLEEPLKRPTGGGQGAFRLDELLDGGGEGWLHPPSGQPARVPPPGAATAASHATIFRDADGKHQYDHPSAYLPETEIEASISAGEAASVGRARVHAAVGLGREINYGQPFSEDQAAGFGGPRGTIQANSLRESSSTRRH